METALYIIGSLALGTLLGWLFWYWRNASQVNESVIKITTLEAQVAAAIIRAEEKEKEQSRTITELGDTRNKVIQLTERVSSERTTNEGLREKLNDQKKELEEQGKKFNTEFENIANRILDTKAEKFTELNKKNIDAILEPLGKNIDEFKKSVRESYEKENRERFSLGERVKELAELNRKISEEANNLTRALKTESKTQGGWGEMILETILEKSGLRKNEEYFMQHQLTDDEGKPLRSDSEGKKMRPDAVIKYPDDRAVIIDSKVTLNAFMRYLASTEPEEQKIELTAHIKAVKERVDELCERGYDDYRKALDFVMMFIPSEPAYIAAMQGDPNLWNYAYEKRILLLNPTNLITSLKLIADLWKRERQNRNAQAIADRGALMYDKLAGFVENLEEIGNHIEQTGRAYSRAHKQLSSGDGNLLKQANELKSLGIKNKKQIRLDPGETS